MYYDATTYTNKVFHLQKKNQKAKFFLHNFPIFWKPHLCRIQSGLLITLLQCSRSWSWSNSRSLLDRMIGIWSPITKKWSCNTLALERSYVVLPNTDSIKIIHFRHMYDAWEVAWFVFKYLRPNFFCQQNKSNRTKERITKQKVKYKILDIFNTKEKSWMFFV